MFGGASLKSTCLWSNSSHIGLLDRGKPSKVSGLIVTWICRAMYSNDLHVLVFQECFLVVLRLSELPSFLLRSTMLTPKESAGRLVKWSNFDRARAGLSSCSRSESFKIGFVLVAIEDICSGHTRRILAMPWLRCCQTCMKAFVAFVWQMCLTWIVVYQSIRSVP